MACLGPGWTNYRRRAQYQVVDITGLLHEGDNVIGAVLAPGWYGGRIASRTAAGSAEPVPVPELLCQLEVDHEAGARNTVRTDELWEWRPSAILSSDLYDGEDWDRRLIDTAWASADDVAVWEPVECTNGTAGAMVVERAEPVRVTSVTDAQVTWLNDGSALIDSGRNDTGFLRLRVDERPGRKVEVRYGEILDPAGQLYRENLRGARCSDSFVCAGDGPEELAPAFSFRGWRYALASGITAPENLRVGRERHPQYGHGPNWLVLVFRAIAGADLRANGVLAAGELRRRPDRLSSARRADGLDGGRAPVRPARLVYV